MLGSLEGSCIGFADQHNLVNERANCNHLFVNPATAIDDHHSIWTS